LCGDRADPPASRSARRSPGRNDLGTSGKERLDSRDPGVGGWKRDRKDRFRPRGRTYFFSNFFATSSIWEATEAASRLPSRAISLPSGSVKMTVG